MVFKRVLGGRTRKEPNTDVDADADADTDVYSRGEEGFSVWKGKSRQRWMETTSKRSLI